MIMARNKDGTYSRVVAIKTRDDEDVIIALDADGDAVFGALPSVEELGVPPLVFRANGVPLVDYSIKGNAVQAATPSHDNPAEVQAVGERTGNLWKTFSNRVSSGVTIVHDGEKYLFSGTCNESINISLSAELDAGTYSLQANASRIPVENISSCIDVWIPSLNKLYNIKNEVATYNTISFSIDTPVKCSLRIRLEKGVNYDGFELKPMLNSGSTPLPYEPYGYKIPFTTAAEDGSESITTTVYLDKPLYKIGDYADTLCYAEQKAERYIKELILTGEEDWTYITGGKHWTPVTTYQKSGLMCTCSHYEAVKNGGGSSFVANGQVGFYSTAADRLIFCNTNYTTTEDWKSYLAEQYAAGTPVKIYYVLQTPESESVELPKLPTLDGTNILDVATEVKPSEVYIKYSTSKQAADYDRQLTDEYLNLMEGM